MYNLKLDQQNLAAIITCGQTLTTDEVIEMTQAIHQTFQFLPSVNCLVDCRNLKQKFTQDEAKCLADFFSSTPMNPNGAVVLVVNPELELEIINFSTLAQQMGIKRRFHILRDIDSAWMYLKMEIAKTNLGIGDSGIWDTHYSKTSH